MIEAGFPGFEMVVYTGILAPAGTPRPIIDRLNVEIAKALGADAVFYQTVTDMNRAVREEGASFEQFCNACFTGKYPTPDVTEDVLLEIERDRLAVR
jgi:glutamine phosphoribosylpyrophosphate amidotransferase